MVENYDLIVMGDINLDWLVQRQLPFAFVDFGDVDRMAWLPIEKIMGGSGLNFARFAKQAGYRPLLLGKVGNDLEGSFILSQLQAESLAPGVRNDEQHPTGLAIIARDHHDIRLLVNNETNANQYLSVHDVRAYQAEIEASKLLYLSGYCFMNPDLPRTDAACEAIRIAKKSENTHIVFDVVPHKFYLIKAYDNFEKFLNLTRDVDVLISETSTLRRILGLGEKSEQITKLMVEETLEYLKPNYSQLILRWGSCDHQVVWDANNQKEVWGDTGHRDAEDKRGFGDKLALQVLREVCNL